MFEFKSGQIVKLTHDSGNEYFGLVVYRLDRSSHKKCDYKFFAETKFFGWNIDLTNIFSPRNSQFKSCELVGQAPENNELLELSPESLQLIRWTNEGKFSDKKWVEEWKNKKDTRVKRNN